MQRDPQTWFKELPPVTKYVLVAKFVFTLSITLGLMSPIDLVFMKTLAIDKLQIWRFITSLLCKEQFSYGWLIHMYLWTNFSSQLEKNPIFFNASPGAYLWFVIIQAFALNLIGLVFFWPMGKPLLTNSFLFAIIYYWSRMEPTSPVSIYFITVKGYQLPFALLFIHLIMGASVWDDLLGLASGHIYYFFHDVLPSERSLSIFPKCPQFLDKLMQQLDPPRSSQARVNPIPSGTWFERNNQNTTRMRPSREPFTGTGHRLGG